MVKIKTILYLIPCLVTASLLAGIKIQDIDKSESIIVKDLRPDSEKVRETFSRLITNPAFGIMRLGDKGVDPAIVRLFQHRVYEKFHEQNDNVNLSVYHFVTYANSQAAARGAGASVAGGLVGAVLNELSSKPTALLSGEDVDRNQFEKLDNSEYLRGVLKEAENPTNAQVYIVYIDAEVGDKRNFVKVVVPIDHSDGRAFYGKAVEAGIRSFLSRY